MRKFFNPVGWLILTTLFFGMGTTLTIGWPVEGLEAGGLSTAPADVATYTWYGLVFMAGYLLAAIGVGYFARGATRARLTFGLGASIVFWVVIGLFVIVGPVVGYANFAPDFGIIPAIAGLGMMISGLIHWNDSEESAAVR
ncbi:MAG: hypothetical protein ACO2Z1_03215 [Pontimonas sp.]